MKIFHGTSEHNAREIAINGFDLDCSSSEQYWGCGVYFFESEEDAWSYGAGVIGWNVPASVIKEKCSIDNGDDPPKMHGQIYHTKESYVTAVRAFKDKMLQKGCKFVKACRGTSDLGNYDCEHIVYDPSIISLDAIELY